MILPPTGNTDNDFSKKKEDIIIEVFSVLMSLGHTGPFGNERGGKRSHRTDRLGIESGSVHLNPGCLGDMLSLLS